ncbi:MAG: helix-turn-helix transcriptional regulator [Rickettsiaceae bacterium]|jgi:DNA-binding CsgD family transcriptional regulator|nr:helix-turn-helix transcriptional regulator [Rickettsiaceae bacterium]
MHELISEIKEILKKEVLLLKKLGVEHLGYRYFLPSGKSFGCPTKETWYSSIRNEDFYNYMKMYLTQELIYLTKNKFCYVTRASDQEESPYLKWLEKLGINNSVGIYKFDSKRIDSFFFICEVNAGKQRDNLINNIQWLEHHVNSLTKQINKFSDEINKYTKEEFTIEKETCAEIFRNISINTKLSTNCINIIFDGKQVSINCRELEVLKLLKTGNSNKAIAFTLGVNEKTVERQLFCLKAKFCLNGKSELITIANSPQLQAIL